MKGKHRNGAIVEWILLWRYAWSLKRHSVDSAGYWQRSAGIFGATFDPWQQLIMSLVMTQWGVKSFGCLGSEMEKPT